MNSEEKPELDELLDHSYCIPNSQILVSKQKSNFVNSKPGEHEKQAKSELLEPKVEETTIKTKSLDDYSKRYLFSKQKQKCVICFKHEKLYGVACKNEQLVLLSGMVVQGKKQIEHARSVFCASIIYTCRAHIPEASNAIFEFLNVKNLDEMRKCSSDNVERLMEKLPSHLTFPEFCSLLEDYIQKCNSKSTEDFDDPVNDDSNATGKISVNSTQKTPRIPYHARCSACKTLDVSDKINHLRSRISKLPAIVGLFMSGRKTFVEARNMFCKTYVHICDVHEKESINAIFKFLNIKCVDEMKDFSVENRQKLEKTLDSLQRYTYPRACFEGFSRALKEYIRKYCSK